MVRAEVFSIVARDLEVPLSFLSSHVLNDMVKPYCLYDSVPQEHHRPSFSSLLKGSIWRD